MKKAFAGPLLIVFWTGVIGAACEGPAQALRYASAAAAAALAWICISELIKPRAGQPSMPRRVFLESPYAGDVDTNLRYLRAAMADCIRRGESPYASHGLLTQPGVLDDLKPEERALGLRAGSAWRDQADVCVVYVDLGVSAGMSRGVAESHALGQPVQLRRLRGEWSRAGDADWSGLLGVSIGERA